MYFEIVGFWGLLCLVGFAMAEMNGRNIVAGVVSAFLLMLLGLTLMSEQIEINTGAYVLNSTNSSINTSTTNLTITQTNSSDAITYRYTGATALGFSVNYIIGIVLILISVWAGFRYMIGVKAK